MRVSELVKELTNAGCHKIREGKRHEIWFSSKTGKKFQVSRHATQEVASGTLKRILQDAGLK